MCRGGLSPRCNLALAVKLFASKQPTQAAKQKTGNGPRMCAWRPPSGELQKIDCRRADDCFRMQQVGRSLGVISHVITGRHAVKSCVCSFHSWLLNRCWVASRCGPESPGAWSPKMQAPAVRPCSAAGRLMTQLQDGDGTLGMGSLKLFKSSLAITKGGQQQQTSTKLLVFLVSTLPVHRIRSSIVVLRGVAATIILTCSLRIDGQGPGCC